MSVELSRPHSHRVFQSAPSALEPKVAVLLDANARQVNERVIRSLTHVVPGDDLYLSRSELDCRRIAQRVLDRRYDTVFLGGGDGTFVNFTTELVREQKRRALKSPMPRLGILRLGTGNALAAFVHASPTRGNGFLDDVLRARSGEVRCRPLDLLSVEGKRAPFAGLGVDAQLLNDYAWIRTKLGSGGLFGPLLAGGGGYFSAAAFKTVPHYLTHSTSVECEVTNGNRGPAYRLAPDGTAASEPIEPGATMFRGRVMMAAAGTIPFYGFGFKIFPFAGRRPGLMHLRLGAMPTSSILANLSKLWKGRWFPDGIHDFHAREVVLRFDRPMPFQIGGDAEGYRDEVRLEIGPEPVQMLDFQGVLN